jgi:5-(aminomethyl)-3-furanmethanol phosphate kinase
MGSVSVSVVIKVGGGLLAHAACFDSVLEQIASASRDASLLVVPGGGPFADAVRDVDQKVGLSDDAAHWMAILAMDQYAHVIASRLQNARLIAEASEIAQAMDQGLIPVLAPYQWMRNADPLPHSWDVTSDSISAWVAGQVGAARLVLVKPPGASGPDIVDPCFKSVLAPHIEAVTVTADRIDQLRRAIAAPAT